LISALPFSAVPAMGSAMSRRAQGRGGQKGRIAARVVRTGIVLISLHALTLMVTALAAQQAGAPMVAPKPEAAAQAQTSDIGWPVSLDRIKGAISRPAAITSATARPVFRVQIFGGELTFEDLLDPDDLTGPTPYGGITHQEFLTLVTPPEYRGAGVFTVGEALTMAAASLGLQWVLDKASDKLLRKIEELKQARTERAKAAARREVLAALEELGAARTRAGLPPR
jgi:hypothetical protein